ncbi:MAG TPA: 2-dehydropantoate 2-reductase [Micromonosporaceae bacterium]|nr:2-dehydropantoate 2-reductase [Micromonosporaceae bacterium]
MRLIVYGAGAIGGALGALLAEAGHEVVLIARGEHLRVIQTDGLLLSTPKRQVRLNLPAVSGPAEIEWHQDDVVLLTMKTPDTEPALRLLPPEVPVVCVQNGVANERIALRYFADVYGVCTMFPATHLTPGVVAAHSLPVPAILNIGRYPSGVDERASQVAQAFQSAGIVSEPLPDIMRWKYTKLLMNLGNALQAVCGSAPEVSKLVRDEGEQVLRKAGIDFASAQENRGLRADLLQVHDAIGQPRTGGSSWQSVARGTGSIESDFLNGEIVLLGRLHGVPTPYNEHARRMANLVARSKGAAGSMTSQEWLSKLDL